MTTAPSAAGPEALAALGPFFAVEVHEPGTAPGPPWRPASELITPSEPLRDRVSSIRSALAARGGRAVSEIEPRVAASAAHLGLVARLVAPALGASVLGCRIGLDPRETWWQDETGGPFPLSVSEGAVPDLHRFLDDVIAPLTAAIAAAVPVSSRVLWGNVASGVNAAAGQIARSHPDLAGRAWEAARELFAGPRLRAERCPPGPDFRRASCCLFYRLAPGVPPASVACGDCVLAEITRRE